MYGRCGLVVKSISLRGSIAARETAPAPPLRAGDFGSFMLTEELWPWMLTGLGAWSLAGHKRLDLRNDFTHMLVEIVLLEMVVRIEKSMLFIALYWRSSHNLHSGILKKGAAYGRVVRERAKRRDGRA